MLYKTKPFFAGLLLMVSSLVQAQMVSVSPVKLEMQAGTRAVALEIGNPDSVPHSYDIKVYEWSGTGEKGSILSTTITPKIITSRPVFTVPEKSKATLRLSVVERSGKPADFYRVIIEDVTPGAVNSLSTKVFVSLPLQVKNSKLATGVLEQMSDGITNIGTGAALVSQYAENGKNVAFMRYILPGETWATKVPLSNVSWIPGIQ